MVTLHVPLERETEHPTWHLIDEVALSAMRPGAWLINTSRGEVVSESHLLAHAADSAAGPVVLDVWSTEPEPHPALVDASRISTPHIAGYAWDAKLEATRMVADAVRSFLRLPVSARDGIDEVIPLTSPESSAGRTRWCHSVIRQMYDIDAESKRFRSEILGARSPGSVFSRFRNEYPSRRSFRCYGLGSSEIPPEYVRVTDVLGIRVVG